MGNLAKKLAKLSDLKALIDTTETDHDDLLHNVLERATEVANGIAGRTLVREQDKTEYPRSPYNGPRRIRLYMFPIESITSIKQLYLASTDAQFTAETAMTEFDDYVSIAEDGALERVNAVWYPRYRWLQVIYTAGFVDPQRIEIALATATWTVATKTLTQVGGFTDYAAFAPGDSIVITGGTGVTKGIYRIASRTSNDAIVLTKKLAEADLATADITSGFSGMELPPDDLQQGLLNEAMQIWNYRATGGVSDVTLASGGSYRAKGLKPHEQLVAACDRLVRREI